MDSATQTFTPTVLQRQSPVPSDLDIAQAAFLKPIDLVARELGLREDELEHYGPTKAKVRLTVLERLSQQPMGATSTSPPSPPHRWAKARPPRPSG